MDVGKTSSQLFFKENSTEVTGEYPLGSRRNVLVQEPRGPWRKVEKDLGQLEAKIKGKSMEDQGSGRINDCSVSTDFSDVQIC